MPLDAGTLTARIALIRDVVSRVAGVEQKAPQTYAQAWASVVYLSGSEAFKAQQVNASVNVRVTMRYREDVLPSHRVLYKGKELEIKAVIPDEVNRESLVLECRG